MEDLSEADLKFFTAAALTGILANPAQFTKEAINWRKIKGISLEKIAVNSALEAMEQIAILKLALDQAAAQKKDPATVLVMNKNDKENTDG